MPSWLSGWSYRKSHEIQGSTAGAQTDYQVRIVVHYGSGVDNGENVYLNGNCKTDFGDIRITDSDGVTVLAGENNGWIEEKVDGDYAVIWVKIPSIPASPDIKTIYIYYGNPSATFTSNGDTTFLFFDDFEDGVIDLEKWTEINTGDLSYCSESDGVLTITANFGDWSIHGLQSIQPVLDAGVAIEERAQKAGTNWGDCLIGYRAVWASEHRESSAWFGYYDGGWVQLGDIHENVWSRYTVKILSSTEFKVVRDGQEWSRTRSAVSLPTVLQVAGSFCASNTVKFDFVAVRKYVDPEPLHGAWGSEETAAVTLSVSVLNESLDKSRGIAGETVTYTATIQDENGNALPSTFKVTLKIDDTILIQDQPLTSDVYDPATKKLTLQWTVPYMSTFHTVKIVWSEQTIDTTIYQAGESTGVEFEIIPIPPTLTPDQICSISLTLIACMVYISFETIREMAENMV